MMENRRVEIERALDGKDWERAARLALRYSREDEAAGERQTAQLWTRLGVECWARTQMQRILDERRRPR